MRIILPDAPKEKQKYEAAFKKRRSGRLLWVHGIFSSEKEAHQEITKYVNKFHQGEGFRLYGGPMIQK